MSASQSPRERSPDDLTVTTTESVPGEQTAAVLGIARGNVVKARNAGADFVESLRNVTGGEMRSYSSLLTEARDEATERMVADAREMGADAVVNVRIDSSDVAEQGAEVIVYGTAVELA